MHAPIDSSEIGQICHFSSGAAASEGIEYAYFKVRMRVQTGKPGVISFSVIVIDQQPDPDTAIGGLE